MEQHVRPPTYTVKQVCEALGTTYNTYLNWERRGVAPRRERLGGRLRRITHEELERWLQQRQEDRRRTGKWHLRHPLPPKSRGAREVAYAGAVAIASSRAGPRLGGGANPARSEAKVRDRLTSDEITDLAVGAIQKGGRS